MINALRILHFFGYAHSDLKMENICARVNKDGQFKFTLIDFGVSSKIPRLNIDTTRKNF